MNILKAFSKEERELLKNINLILWNNPNRINEMRKGRNEKTLTKEEYQKYERKSKENSKELANYMKYLEEKYGGKLSMIEKYYNTISR